MQRIYITESFIENKIIPVEKKQCHYLINVLRLKSQDKIKAFNGMDGEWLAEILLEGKKNCSLQLKEKLKEQSKESDLWLCFAPVKNQSLNYIVQKATELGVSDLYPIITQRTNVSRVNVERLRLIAIEAAEQSDRLTVPNIYDEDKLTNCLSKFPEDRKIIFCDETGKSPNINEVFAKLEKGKYAIFIGPEGGFSKQEYKIISSQPNVVAVCMGPRILKADTAAISAISCFQSQLGDWDKKPNFNYED